MRKIFYTLFIALTLLASFSLYRNAHAAVIGAIPVNPSNTLNTLTKGLTGYWTFDGKDVVNGVAQDKSGNGHNGSLVNIATSTFYVPGKIGEAFNFSSKQNGYVGHLSPQSNFMSTTDGSMSAWVYPTSVAGGDCSSGDYGDVLQDGQTNAGGYVWMGMDSSLKFCFGGSDGAGNQNYVSSAQSLNKWYLITWVHTGGSVYGYVNGVQVATGALGTIANQSTEMTIGESYSSHTFNGIIDDARIYNRALSASEVQQLYSMGVTKSDVSPKITQPLGLSNGLVGYWTFDGKDTLWTSSTAATTIDRSGNGNTGTLNKMNVATSTGAGKIGDALNFDGVGAYVYNGSPTGLPSGASPRTYSAWFKLSSIPTTDSTIFDIVGNGGTDAGAEGYSAIAISRGVNSQTGVQQIFWDTRSSGKLWSWTPDTKWHHLVGVYPTGGGTNNTLIMYLDGNLLSTGATCVGACGTLSNAVGALTIGAVPRTCCAEAQFFPGLIDDVRIYNRALSAGEVVQLYNEGTNKYAVSPKFTSGNGLTKGLVGYWTFDGNTVNSIIGGFNDMSGNGQFATIQQGALTTVPGKIGQAVSFAGNGNYATTPASSILNFGGQGITVSTWLYPTAPQIGNQAVFVQRNSCLPPAFINWQLYSHENATGNVYFDVFVASTEYTAHANVLPVKKWSMVTGKYDGSNVYLYINGVQVAATPVTGNMQSNSAVTNFGQDSCSSWYTGAMDDARIYNRALSATEIKELYNMGR